MEPYRHSLRRFHLRSLEQAIMRTLSVADEEDSPGRITKNESYGFAQS
jgi:hypothetical protein